MTVMIRDAKPEDETRWRKLWADYLAFYGVGIAPDITDKTWRRVFDPASAIFMRVAEVDGEVKGFTLCLTHEGTWVRTPDCYLEDLFVDENARGLPFSLSAKRTAGRGSIGIRKRATSRPANSTTAMSRATDTFVTASVFESRKTFVEGRMIALPICHAALG